MARLLRVALIQAHPVNNDFTHPGNVDHALELLEKSCRGEPDIAVFPEYFPFHDDSRLAKAASDCGFFVIAGIRYTRNGSIYNTATVYGPDGSIVARQGKKSIGRLEARLWGFQPWPYEYVVIDARKWRLGVAVCADFWSIPEAALELFLAGAEVFINPSYMFSLARHWIYANLVRSLEFYMPVIGVDTAAFPLRSKRFVFNGGGYSHVIVPPATPEEAMEWWSGGAESAESWIRLRLGTNEEIAFYQLDLDALASARRDWWRRMRGMELEEWIRRRVEMGYPTARVVHKA